jgi:hypothetical protein
MRPARPQSWLAQRCEAHDAATAGSAALTAEAWNLDKASYWVHSRERFANLKLPYRAAGDPAWQGGSPRSRA